jgi:hypothetical protein
LVIEKGKLEMSGPAFAQDYAAQLQTAKYGYLGRILRPGMSQEQMRTAINNYQRTQTPGSFFGYLTKNEVETLVNNYEVVASSGDPSRGITSGLDAVGITVTGALTPLY